MNKAIKKLWKLQNLEETLAEKLRTPEPEVGELKLWKKEIEGKQHAYGVKKEELQKVLKLTRYQESELTELKGKLQEVESLLYDDKNTSAKELEQVQKKGSQIQEKINLLEDDILKNMEVAEVAQKELSGLKKTIEEEIRGFKHQYSKLQQQRSLQKAEVDQLEEKINNIKKEIDSECLQWFQNARTKFPDRKPVSAVIKDTCEGCNMVISYDLIKRLKLNNASEEVICDNCGRLIYLK